MGGGGGGGFICMEGGGAPSPPEITSVVPLHEISIVTTALYGEAQICEFSKNRLIR